MNRRLCSLFFLLLLALSLRAQFDNASFQSVKDEYPEENRIKLVKKIRLTIELKKGVPEIIKETSERFLYLKNNRGTDPKQSTYTSGFVELTDFEAATWALENGKYKKYPVKDYNEIRKFNRSVFYDDSKELVFTFPGVGEGSILELNTTHRISDPRFLGTFFLQDYIPIHEYELTVECDKDVDIDFVRFHIPDGVDELEMKIKGGKKIYTLRKQKVEDFDYEKFQPDIRYFTPHIIPVIRSYTVEGAKVPVLETTEDLYTWYYSFVGNVNDDVDHAVLQKIVDQVITDEMTELEKVRKLYFWVQENIKYIAFEDGMGGFIPRRADEVLKKRYGDCKDKTSLLKALLAEAGISSFYTWIGSRDLPYSYSEISTPQVDNHMIVTYRDGEDYYFLDGTGSYQDIDIPTAFIQGKEALIGIDSVNYEIRTVPVIEAEKNCIVDSVLLVLDQNDIIGSGRTNVSGFPKIDMQYMLDTDDSKYQKKGLEQLLQLGSNKFVLTEYQLPENARFAPQYDLSYSFSLDDYAVTAGDNIYLNLNLDHYWLQYKLDEDKMTPFEMDNTLSIRRTFILRIPEGYSVSQLPDHSGYDSGDFSYTLDYRQEEGEIIYEHQVKSHKILLDKQDYSEWNHFISSLEKDYKTTLLITKDNAQ